MNGPAQLFLFIIFVVLMPSFLIEGRKTRTVTEDGTILEGDRISGYSELTERQREIYRDYAVFLIPEEICFAVTRGLLKKYIYITDWNATDKNISYSYSDGSQYECEVFDDHIRLLETYPGQEPQTLKLPYHIRSKSVRLKEGKRTFSIGSSTIRFAPDGLTYREVIQNSPKGYDRVYLIIEHTKKMKRKSAEDFQRFVDKSQKNRQP